MKKRQRKSLGSLGKFYFKFQKILNKISEISEQALKRLEFLWAQNKKIETEEITEY